MCTTRNPNFQTQTGLTEEFISRGTIFYFLSLLALFSFEVSTELHSFFTFCSLLFSTDSSLSINVTFSFLLFLSLCCEWLCWLSEKAVLLSPSLPLCLCVCCLIKMQQKGLWRPTPPTHLPFFVPTATTPHHPGPSATPHPRALGECWIWTCFRQAMFLHSCTPPSIPLNGRKLDHSDASTDKGLFVCLKRVETH